MKDEINVALAWVYAAIRIVHSLVQATSNYVPARFFVFAGSSLVVLAIAVRNAVALFV